MDSSEEQRNVLVLGAGVCGIQASLDLADMGFRVYVVERKPSIGGHMAQLDKTFPTLDCSACILTPKMVDIARHPNIKLWTYAELEEVRGHAGDFKVKVRKKARYVDVEKCTGCGECTKECPVEVEDEFNMGLNKRKAVYRLFPQAVPNAFVIDKKGTPNCRATCPAGVNAQGYIALIRQRKFGEALESIRRSIAFPAVCGRVCFHPCEAECQRGKVDEPLAIAALKRFVSDYELNVGRQKPEPIPKSHSEKVAIIGSGPSGLTVAYELVKSGYSVTVFESLPEPGGMLRYGIPEYRLPKTSLDSDIEYIKDLGVEIKTNISIGRDFGINELLQQGYKAIYVGVGAQRGAALRIEGEQLEGVRDAITFLRDIGLGKEVQVGERVAVVGGGNVAIDAARSALRRGCQEVNLFYRRSREEMPAYPWEVEEAEREGVKLHFLANPTRVLGKDGKVVGVECTRMKLGEPDESGRRSPIPIDGSEFVTELDMVITAIGQSADLSLLPKNIEATRQNTIEADEITLETTLPGVFAGGDVVSGPASVIEAIAAGQRAAVSIDRFLKGEDIKAGRKEEIERVEDVQIEGVEKKKRQVMPLLPIDQRVGNFREVEFGLTEEMAVKEAERCLSCAGCSECLECEKLCQANAIVHQQKEEYVDLDVAAIVVTTGFEIFDAIGKKEYGYRKYPDVITGLEFERLINAGGPTGGHLLRPSNGKVPNSIAFVQCVGSRDEKINNLNCSRVCCMYAVKQAILIKEHYPDTNIDIFYTDLRAFGKGFEEFYKRAEHEFKINFIRGAVGEIVEDLNTNQLVLRAGNSDTGEVLEKASEMIILSVGLKPTEDVETVGKILGIPQGEDGFFASIQPEISTVETQIEGIYIAGVAEGPKDIPDSIAQASAAAMKAGIVASRGKSEGGN